MADVESVWNQKSVPVIWRKSSPPILLRVPFKEGNRAWIRNNRRTEPAWNKDLKRWELPAAWFNDLVDRGLERWGKIYILQPYRAEEKCAPACRRAEGHVCQCSCMGMNHGANDDAGWFDVSDTFSTRWGHEDVACRLLTRRKSQQLLG